MLQCDLCQEWFHGDCLSPKILEEEADRFLKFHCQECTILNGPSILRPSPIARPQRETRTMINYSELHQGVAEDERRFAKMISTKRFAPNKFPYMNGEDVTLEWMRKTGLKEPIIIEEPDGLEMRMPPSSLTVEQVADLCGRDRIIEAMEVSTQQDKQMTLDEWARYFSSPEDKRRRLFNVISLEIGSTPLSKEIVRPRIVRELDWTEIVWPPRSVREEYPRVQLYCLMSVKDCFTDFHIDFGGSSVFYHLLSGKKIFYFVRPTSTNLKKYEKWSSSPDQNRIFFGDEVKECVEVRLSAGNTMIIPSGWIHAVYTPEDSVVIGGNFLQGIGMSTQLSIYAVENKTGVPPKFRYPYFVQMQWFAAAHYLSILLNDPSTLSHWELDGLCHLREFLASEADTARRSNNPGSGTGANTSGSSGPRKLARANMAAVALVLAPGVDCIKVLKELGAALRRLGKAVKRKDAISAAVKAFRKQNHGRNSGGIGDASSSSRKKLVIRVKPIAPENRGGDDAAAAEVEQRLGIDEELVNEIEENGDDGDSFSSEEFDGDDGDDDDDEEEEEEEEDDGDIDDDDEDSVDDVDDDDDDDDSDQGKDDTSVLQSALVRSGVQTSFSTLTATAASSLKRHSREYAGSAGNSRTSAGAATGFDTKRQRVMFGGESEAMMSGGVPKIKLSLAVRPQPSSSVRPPFVSSSSSSSVRPQFAMATDPHVPAVRTSHSSFSAASPSVGNGMKMDGHVVAVAAAMPLSKNGGGGGSSSSTAPNKKPPASVFHRLKKKMGKLKSSK